MLRQLLLGAALLAAVPVLAQVIDPAFTSPSSVYTSGAVYTLGPPQADGKRVLAGAFTRAGGQVASRVARLNADGSVDQGFRQNVGTCDNVYRVKAAPGGKYLLGAWGGTIVAGGLSRVEALRLNADGTGDASFDPGSGPNGGSAGGYASDYAAQADGKVLIGGSFTSWSGTSAPCLVRLMADGTVDQTFVINLGSGLNPTVDDEVYSLAVQADGKILVGGYFTSFGGHAANGLVRLNADGTYDASFTSGLAASAAASYLVLQPDGKVLVQTNGLDLVRLLPNGSRDTGFSAVGQFYSNYSAPMALQADGKIVVIGILSGTNRTGRLNSDGTLDYTFQPLVYSGLSGVGVQPNGDVLLTSPEELTNFNGTDATVAAYSSAGLLQSTYTPRLQAPGTVRTTLRLADGTLVAGGSFTEWNGQPAHCLVHMSSTGAFDGAFSAALGTGPTTGFNTPSVLGTANSLVQQPDGKLLVGSSRGVMRLLPSGSPDGSFTPRSTVVTSLALQADGKVLLGGSFTVSSGSTTYRGLIRLSSTGSFDNTFVRGTSSIGTATGADALLAQPDGKVVVAGNFTANGSSTPYVIRYESTGAVDASFTPLQFLGASSRLYALVRQPDGKLLAGGLFVQAGNVGQSGVARLTTTGQLDSSFGPGSNLGGTVLSLAVQPNNRILVGGRFTTTSGNTNLTRLLASGLPDASFTSTSITPNNSVYSLLVQPDGGILLGGAFTSLGTQTARNLVRIAASDVLAVAAPAAVAATSLWPVPAHEVLHVLPAPTAHPLGAELLDALGRVVRQQALAGPGEFGFDTRALPAGLYVLRVRYAEGTVGRQVAVE